jgi:hypothetical protein
MRLLRRAFRSGFIGAGGAAHLARDKIEKRRGLRRAPGGSTDFVALIRRCVDDCRKQSLRARRDVEAEWMTPAARTDGYVTRDLRGVRDVEDDIVRTLRVVRRSWQNVRAEHDAVELVVAEGVARSPGDEMVGAGGVAADADCANPDAILVKREPTAEHVHAADALTDHRIR